MWRKRIKDIQYLSCVVISYFSESQGSQSELSVHHTMTSERTDFFLTVIVNELKRFVVNSKMAIIALCYLLYSTIAREIELMLKAPTDMDEIYEYIDRMQSTQARNQVCLLPLFTSRRRHRR